MASLANDRDVIWKPLVLERLKIQILEKERFDSSNLLKSWDVRRSRELCVGRGDDFVNIFMLPRVAGRTGAAQPRLLWRGLKFILAFYEIYHVSSTWSRPLEFN